APFPTAATRSLQGISDEVQASPHSPPFTLHEAPERAIPRGEHRPGTRERVAKAPSIMHIQLNISFPLGNAPPVAGNASFPFAPTHSPGGKSGNLLGNPPRREPLKR